MFSLSAEKERGCPGMFKDVGIIRIPSAMTARQTGFSCAIMANHGFRQGQRGRKG
jgi:hypothetical protein